MADGHAQERITVSSLAFRDLPAGPAELRDELPLVATVLRVIPGPQGRGEFWCARLERPVKYRIGDAFDTTRCQPEFLGHDSAGQFLWIQIIVMSAHHPGQRIQPGITTGMQVDVAYVVDLTLGQDSALDPAKVDYAGIAIVDDQPGLLAVRAGLIDRVQSLVSALKELSGQDLADHVPQPLGPNAVQGDKLYAITSAHLRYYDGSHDTGQGWRSTTDPDELLYWIADDLARDAAWEWTQRTPSAVRMDQHQLRDLLWIPQWLLLLTALDPRWAQRTRRSVLG
ncbi:hypothetical protein [Mycolicibacterium fortuitum]